MSDDYSTIKTFIDNNFENNPAVLIRGDVANSGLTKILQFARDRIGGLPFDATDVANNMTIIYENATSKFKLHKKQRFTKNTILEMENISTMRVGDTCRVEDNGFGAVENYEFAYDIITLSEKWCLESQFEELQSD